MVLEETGPENWLWIWGCPRSLVSRQTNENLCSLTRDCYVYRILQRVSLKSSTECYTRNRDRIFSEAQRMAFTESSMHYLGTKMVIAVTRSFHRVRKVCQEFKQNTAEHKINRFSNLSLRTSLYDKTSSQQPMQSVHQEICKLISHLRNDRISLKSLVLATHARRVRISYSY